MPAITRDLNVIARCGMQFRGLRLAKLSLTAAQAPFILHIVSQPGQSQEELAQKLHINPSNVARQLSLLEGQGFVLRQPLVSDKRRLAVYPTDKTRNLAPQVRRINGLWHDHLTLGMSAEEIATLEDLLGKMRRQAVLWDTVEEDLT